MEELLMKLSDQDLVNFQKYLLTATYKQAIMQLLIVQRSQRLKSFHYEKKKTKRVSIPLSIDEEDKHIPDEKTLNEIKLERELEALISIYKVANEELNLHNEVGENPIDKLNFTQLETAVDALKLAQNEEEKLQQENKELKAKLKALKEEIVNITKDKQQYLEQQDEEISIVKHNFKNVYRLNALELKLVQRWEHNRYVQAKLVCDQEERALQQQIDECQQRLKDEQRVINAIEKFRTKECETLRKRIDEWQEKYSTDVKEMEKKISEKELRIIGIERLHEHHLKVYEERVEFVNDYRAKKAEELRLYQEQVHRVQCAVRIQAWWRGLMVRCGLGPYKKKSKKGKKGKGKGK